MSRRLLTIVLATAAVLAGAAGAQAATLHTQTATASGVTATFSFRGAQPTVTDAHLTIARNGQTLYDAPVSSPACGTLCGPAQFGGGSADSVGIVPLVAGSPSVVLELYSGGANCCFIDQIFSYDPGTNTYVKAERNFASAGASLRRLGGQWRFVSADDNFKYAFTDGADSGEPIQIWQFTAGQFVDVTRRYRGLIRRDAAFWLRIFDHHVANGVGLIAAWAADEELLGRDRLVQSTLEHELAAGRLRAGDGNFFAGGARFVRALNRLLVKLHYRR